MVNPSVDSHPNLDYHRASILRRRPDMVIGKYSIGVGDRFGHQGQAQLRAVLMANEMGVEVTPVWNKSYREHMIIGTDPSAVRQEADAAVQSLGWTGQYFVDADHVGLANVDLFMASSDYFTLDVADLIGHRADSEALSAFAYKHARYVGELDIPGIDRGYIVDRELIIEIAARYLMAVKEAGKLYRHIESAKGKGSFITEVSMDETDQPQTPVELLFILSALAEEGIPAQAIAPKFTGRFNKGVDYVGNLDRFTREFREDIAVIDYAVTEFDLPSNLKLSIHSGSDKFSIYDTIREVIREHNAGLHLKTAGTTWLEELIGLASAGGDGLALAKEVYRRSLARYDELCGPYSSVIDIDMGSLPSVEEVDGWEPDEYAASLRHDPSCASYNPNLRQLLHVGYKVAAEMGARYRDALMAFEESVSLNVIENIYERHLTRVFL
jgi:hypothetical protein